MEHDKRFLKGFFCGLGVTVVCGLFAYFISGEIVRYRLLERNWEISTESESQTEEKKLSQTLNIDHKALLKKMEEIEERINRDYLNTMDSQEVETQIYKGLMRGLEDPYAAYYTKDELDKIKESTSGSYKGIGARMVQNKDTGVITIVNCFEGTPAAKAGLLPGDILYKVGDKEVTGVDLSLVISEIKSLEGDTVHLTLVRETEEDYIEVDVVREEINVPTVYSEMLENNIGYLQVTEFDIVTKTQFTDAISSLKSEGMTKLIIDLRDNPGGVLQVVCNMLEQILPKGLIVYTEDKYGNRQEYTSNGEGGFELPLVLLVNENSASASEIFAGAVKDYGIGTLVGTTTYGKGIVQRIENLSDGTALKLTVENYYTPKGNNIHGIGIEPDVSVELDKNAKSNTIITREKDNQLQKAIEILEEK